MVRHPVPYYRLPVKRPCERIIVRVRRSRVGCALIERQRQVCTLRSHVAIVHHILSWVFARRSPYVYVLAIQACVLRICRLEVGYRPNKGRIRHILYRVVGHPCQRFPLSIPCSCECVIVRVRRSRVGCALIERQRQVCTLRSHVAVMYYILSWVFAWGCPYVYSLPVQACILRICRLEVGYFTDHTCIGHVFNGVVGHPCQCFPLSIPCSCECVIVRIRSAVSRILHR